MPALAARLRPLSLRGRLILASVMLVALGLIAAESATYFLLRSNLVGRIDEQLRAVGVRVGVAFEVPTPGSGAPGGEPGFGGGGRRLGAPPDGGARALPETYAALLDASGAVESERATFFGEAPVAPNLPAGLPGSTSGPSQGSVLLTAGSDDGIRYRVLATARQDAPGTAILAFPLTEVDATLRRLLLVEGIVTAAVLAGVAALALWLVRLGMRPLTQMEHAAADIADGDLSRRVTPSDDRTEVGRLGRALNVMLEKIEAAFAERRVSEERLRRFVADASHELRTPLTSIRGYAELFRHGADERPEDLAKSMRRIEDESARMATLVEELLLLARLDQGRPLERRPVDLAQIAADAVEDARAVQPDRPIELECAGNAFLEGDEARLRQVAANLLSNALHHTPTGTPVRVRVAKEADRATLTVADGGPGLDAESAARIFDRFFRVDPSRSRDNGGSGLGMSIVAAIVRAHGGEVTLETAPGKGARFSVSIPATPSKAVASAQEPHRRTS